MRGNRRYLAGKITGLADAEAVFAEYAARWRAKGYVVVNPCEIDVVLGFAVGGITTDFALRWDLPVLAACHGAELRHVCRGSVCARSLDPLVCGNHRSPDGRYGAKVPCGGECRCDS